MFLQSTLLAHRYHQTWCPRPCPSRTSSPLGCKIKQAALRAPLASLGACIISSRALPRASGGIRAMGRGWTRWSPIANMRNYPAPLYSSSSSTLGGSGLRAQGYRRCSACASRRRAGDWAAAYGLIIITENSLHYRR